MVFVNLLIEKVSFRASKMMNVSLYFSSISIPPPKFCVENKSKSGLLIIKIKKFVQKRGFFGRGVSSSNSLVSPFENVQCANFLSREGLNLFRPPKILSSKIKPRLSRPTLGDPSPISRIFQIIPK